MKISALPKLAITSSIETVYMLWLHILSFFLAYIANTCRPLTSELRWHV